MDEEIQKVEVEPEKKSGSIFSLKNSIWLVIVLGILFIAFTLIQPEKPPQELKLINSNKNIDSPKDVQVKVYEFNALEQPVREKWFQELRKINRDGYKIIETTAKNKGLTEEQALAYFGLNSEQEIFESLPEPTQEFSEIKYATEQGIIIENKITPNIYLQPEFLPNSSFEKNCLPYWTQNDPNYWATNGYGFYPARQNTVIKTDLNENNFSGWFIVHSSCGVQTWQGMKLQPQVFSETIENPEQFFDLQISPDEFLLEPTFPKYYRNWAKKITITGTIKSNTPKGSYTITVNPVTPSQNKINEWQAEHLNLYFNAISSGFKPSQNMLEISVVVN